MKALSGVLESSRQALSIGGSFKAYYRSFVNVVNSRGVQKVSGKSKIASKNRI